VVDILGPGWLEGRRVVDLCCGSGAVGIECMGCGAEHCTFVDSSPAAVAFVRSELESLGVRSGFATVCIDVRKLDLRALRPADLVFVDPPYEEDSVYSWIASVDWAASVTRGGLVFVESGAGKPPPGRSWTSRRYGDSRLSWLEIG